MESLIQIARPSPPAIVQEMAPAVAEAYGFIVQGKTSHGEALERARLLRQAERVLTDHYEPTRKALDQAKKELLAARDKMVAPMTEARRVYELSAGKYEAAERRKAEDESRRLAELARLQEEERQLQEAVLAEEAGDTDEAEAILAAPVSVPTVYVQPAVAQVESVSARTTWSAEVTDLLALVRHVAANPRDVNLLLPNGPALNKLAMAHRENLSIPGVRAAGKQVRSYGR